MENEKEQNSIFEQEDYDGGFSSGPLAAAPEEDDDIETAPESDNDDDLDIDA